MGMTLVKEKRALIKIGCSFTLFLCSQWHTFVFLIYIAYNVAIDRYTTLPGAKQHGNGTGAGWLGAYSELSEADCSRLI